MFQRKCLVLSGLPSGKASLGSSEPFSSFSVSKTWVFWDVPVLVYVEVSSTASADITLPSVYSN
jgi:hypothetical protein